MTKESGDRRKRRVNSRIKNACYRLRLQSKGSQVRAERKASEGMLKNHRKRGQTLEKRFAKSSPRLPRERVRPLLLSCPQLRS